jgi:hypothetical protein
MAPFDLSISSLDISVVDILAINSLDVKMGKSPWMDIFAGGIHEMTEVVEYSDLP